MDNHKIIEQKPELYPCEMTIKVIGANIAGFVATIKQGLATQFPANYLSEANNRTSRDNKFISAGFKITVENREQLDSLYSYLNKLEIVKMVI